MRNVLNNGKICIFCSSSNELDEKYYNAAKDIAKLIAAENADLVYGGGSIGIMGVIARTFQDCGRKVLSVIPEKLNKKGIVYDDSDELIVTQTMSERKRTMGEISDGFIALPGGFGTLEEILEIITLKQLKYHNKPVAFLNTEGFYDKLIGLFDEMYKKRFVKDVYRSLYFVSEDPQVITDHLKNYIEPVYPRTIL
jgi:cytokinin riboside 5'-monophosphate phosphoribohydrolase